MSLLRVAAITIKECPSSLNRSIWQLVRGFGVEVRRYISDVYDTRL